MKSGKPKTKRYQFGGTLRSQISGTRNAPPPTRPAPAPAKPVPVTPPGGQVQDKINTKPPLNKMWDILLGRAPAPNIPSTPNKPPVEYVDDLEKVYELAKNPTSFPVGKPPPPRAGVATQMPATTATTKPAPLSPQYMKKGGAVKAYAKGGKVSSASSRGDGIAQRGKTKGRMV